MRCKLALDRYLEEKGHPWKSLVAFSGTVEDGGQKYTESGMNSAGKDRVIGERQTAGEFEKPEYRFLVVANKFQTGFDQPLLHTIAAFLNTEGGDLLIGVADDRSVLGIDHDRLEVDDKFLRHLAQVVRNALGDRASTCIDPKTQIVEGKTVCLVSCQRSPEPVFLRWRGTEAHPQGDLYVRSGPGSVRLSPDDVKDYIRTRFPDSSGGDRP